MPALAAEWSASDDGLTVLVDALAVEANAPHVRDLFRGGQLLVMGRYRGTGHAAIKLTGKVNGAERQFVYEASFAKESKDMLAIRDRRAAGIAVFRQISGVWVFPIGAGDDFLPQQLPGFRIDTNNSSFSVGTRFTFVPGHEDATVNNDR